MSEVSNAKTDPNYLLQLIGAAVWLGDGHKLYVRTDFFETHHFDVEITETNKGGYAVISVVAKPPRRIQEAL